MRRLSREDEDDDATFMCCWPFAKDVSHKMPRFWNGRKNGVASLACEKTLENYFREKISPWTRVGRVLLEKTNLHWLRPALATHTALGLVRSSCSTQLKLQCIICTTQDTKGVPERTNTRWKWNHWKTAQCSSYIESCHWDEIEWNRGRHIVQYIQSLVPVLLWRDPANK